MPKHCHACQSPWSEKRSPGFRETCLKCGADLHVCRNCRFHDRDARQGCREPQARHDKPRDPETSNTCDWFVFSDAAGNETPTRAEDAKAKLHALFGTAPPRPEKPPDWTRPPDVDTPFDPFRGTDGNGST